MIEVAIIKSISTKNITNLDKYILNGEAHDKTLTTHRNLLVGGHNIKKDYAGNYNAMYIASQNYAVRKLAGKTGKKTQGFHIIISFSEQDFPKTSDEKELKKQSQEAYKLVFSLLSKELPENSQYLIGIQRDGKGGMLHAHVALNSVQLDNKTLNTNILSLNHKLTLGKQINGKRERKKEAGLYERTQDFFEDNFENITGRKYQRIERDTSDLIQANEVQLTNKGVKTWKDELKDEIVEIAQTSVSTDDFKQKMKDIYNVTVEEKRAGIGKDENGKKIYRKAFTYKIKDSSGQFRKSRDFRYLKNGSIRGLGTDYTPQSLEKQFELVRQKQQQELNNELVRFTDNNLKKVSVIDGTEQIQQPRESTEEREFEPRTRQVKRIKQVKTKTSKATSFNTTEYDKQTKQLERTIQEAVRRQQQQNANAERKRKQREQERENSKRERERQQEQARRNQTTANNNQEQKYTTSQSTINTERQSSQYESDDWDFE